jgi:pimeloyl-[acyl-carrier protein] methyl ester esterase
MKNTLSVKTFGQGPDLALIHGWGLGSAAWQPITDRLAPRFRLHLVSLPGYESTPELAPLCPESRASIGSTEAEPGEALFTPLFSSPPCRTSMGAALRAAHSTPANFEYAARYLIEALPAGVTLCGWSLGALLALQAAWLEPGHIARLILVGATPSFTQRTDWTLGQPAALLDTFQAALDNHRQATLHRFIAVLNQGDTQARAISRTLLASLADKPLPDGKALIDGLRFLREIDLRQQVPSVHTPTLLIQGEKDPLMPLAAAHWLAEHLPAAPVRLEIFAGAAHAPFLNDPQRFATLLTDFCHAPTPR